ncbi:CRISPR system precrRNA processing endoribonuclease RAMP protein Cas6 [Crenalkalicoccus roseus]|uniref:CRISPR system precrRNA processing endoribonuclease RAMP protein Cas6 n=1 Tax=Crenalkalicoccus roseus TaxID=1485588 RepID=UPI0010802B13|nr:CRISPR system precrRNA processing endoribonuclease RAMP protein Cas6 [Crenalkalicoccus roseus]
MAATLSLGGVRRLDFAFVPRAALCLQAHAGSAWRGAFGHALKRMVCAMRLRPCEGCPLADGCLYTAFFGAGADHDAARPFILSPEPLPRDGLLRAGRPFTVRLTLLPGAEAAAAYAVRALLRAAEQGLSGRRVALDCVSVTDAATGEPLAPHGSLPAPVACVAPPPPPAVELRFTSPLRIRLAGDLLTARTLRPGHLVGAALRRLRLLGFGPSPDLAAAARKEAEGLAFAAARLGWLETTRFSSRQNSAMQFGGIVGEAVLDLRGAPHVWPPLWAASILHLGKGAAMGFGRVEARAR